MNAKLGYKSLMPFLLLISLTILLVICLFGAILSYNKHNDVVDKRLLIEQAKINVDLFIPEYEPSKKAASKAELKVEAKAELKVGNEADIDQKKPIKSVHKKQNLVDKPVNIETVVIKTANANKKIEEKVSDKKAVVVNTKVVENNLNQNTDATMAVSSEMVQAAKKNNKIEGVDSNRIGITKINSTNVILKNGSTIKVGEKFPSGEFLLSLDPDNGQIITNKRTILIF